VDIRSRANTTRGLDFEHMIKALAYISKDDKNLLKRALTKQTRNNPRKETHADYIQLLLKVQINIYESIAIIND
jgi:hypothetical protein